MAILIDGYNLLYASGILGRGRGPGFLQRSRQALLNVLAESLPEKERNRCTVVFDASDSAPRGLPRITRFQGITVSYASGLPSADELIEQLILRDSAPRHLTVVSSDHRLHRAAKRRRAKPIDSDVWFRALLRQRAQRHDPAEHLSAKPTEPTEGEIAFWMRQFGAGAEEPSAEEENKPTSNAAEKAAAENPFPPGYGEDLLEDEE